MRSTVAVGLVVARPAVGVEESGEAAHSPMSPARSMVVAAARRPPGRRIRHRSGHRPRSSALRRRTMRALSRPARPSRSRRSRSSASRRIWAARASASPAGARRPVSPSATTSGTPPTPGGHHGESGGHPLDQGQGDSLAPARQEHDVGRPDQPGHVGTGAEAEYVGPQAQVARSVRRSGPPPPRPRR